MAKRKKNCYVDLRSSRVMCGLSSSALFPDLPISKLKNMANARTKPTANESLAAASLRLR